MINYNKTTFKKCTFCTPSYHLFFPKTNRSFMRFIHSKVHIVHTITPPFFPKTSHTINRYLRRFLELFIQKCTLCTPSHHLFFQKQAISFMRFIHSKVHIVHTISLPFFLKINRSIIKKEGH